MKVRTGTVLTLVIKQNVSCDTRALQYAFAGRGAALTNLIYIATTYFFLFNFLLRKRTPSPPCPLRSELGTIMFASDPSCNDDTVITQYVFGPAELLFRYTVCNSSATKVTGFRLNDRSSICSSDGNVFLAKHFQTVFGV